MFWAHRWSSDYDNVPVSIKSIKPKYGVCIVQNDPLPGRISARINFTDKELLFGEKDTKSKVTLLEGDHVQFNISTDRRDKLERATNIEILPDTFRFTKESREMVRLEII